MKMYKQSRNQEGQVNSESRKAQEHVGKRLLFGITYVDQENNMLEQKQGCGEIIEITSELLKIKLNSTGEIFTLPPFANELEIALPGEYKLRSTGEVVVNPDLLGRFLCLVSDPQSQIET